MSLKSCPVLEEVAMMVVKYSLRIKAYGAQNLKVVCKHRIVDVCVYFKRAGIEGRQKELIKGVLFPAHLDSLFLGVVPHGADGKVELLLMFPCKLLVANSRVGKLIDLLLSQISHKFGGSTSPQL